MDHTKTTAADAREENIRHRALLEILFLRTSVLRTDADNLESQVKKYAEEAFVKSVLLLHLSQLDQVPDVLQEQ